MSESSRARGAAMVRRALVRDLETHVRVQEQGLALDEGQRMALASAFPVLEPFGSSSYASVRAVLDWDHRLPSEYLVLRVFASHTEDDGDRVLREIRARDTEIDKDNLYPEFDLPDYGEIESSEVYAATLEPGSLVIDELRLLNEWRRQVASETAEPVLAAVRASQTYRRATLNRTVEGLGTAVVVGWAPPCLAESEHWAVEVWLITEFDGQSGKARVYMVDSEIHEITREFETDVHLA